MRVSLKRVAALAVMAMSLFAASVPFADGAAQAPTPGSFVFEDWPGPPLRVFLLRPENAADDAHVVFVMHGVNRDADRYFADWRPLAKRHGFVLAVPEFSKSDFPGAANYNLGGVIDERGAATDRATWAFAAIEPLFDAARERLGLSTGSYVVYGHSAGAQFVHRFAMFGIGARARMVIAANAGWYTFPDEGDWPYGPRGLPDGVYDEATALAAPLVILAGENDTDPAHPSLRRTPEANAQGATRFERALAFYAAASALAAETALPFNWSCSTAPGVDHNDAKAAPFAVALIVGAPPPSGAPCQKLAAPS